LTTLDSCVIMVSLCEKRLPVQTVSLDVQSLDIVLGIPAMRIDVGPLLREPLDAQVDIDLNLGFQCLSDDVDVLSIRGTLNLWRTTEGIWVRGSLAVDVDQQCVRCLAPVTNTSPAWKVMLLAMA